MRFNLIYVICFTMFKFIHAADIHLDSPLYKLDSYEGAPVDEIRQATRRAFKNLVQTAIDEHVDFIIIAGDLYDGDWKDFNTGLYLVSQTGKLREAGISVYITYGNHDAASRITRALRLPDNVHIFPSNEPATFSIHNLHIAIHGMSFAVPAIKEDLSRLYPSPIPGYFNIGVLHTSLSGREGHEPYAPSTLAGLRQKGYDYWALGHVHTKEILCADPPILFPGNIQGRHIREAGPKGCMLVSVDDKGSVDLEFKPLDVTRWAMLNVDSKGAETGYDIIDLFREQLENLLNENPGMPLVVRVIIEGETPAHQEVLSNPEKWNNEIRAAALDTSREMVWVEKIQIRMRAPLSGQNLRERGEAMGELLKLFDELAADPDLLHCLSDELIDLDKKIPKEIKEGPDGIRINDVKWLKELLEQARPMLIQRLMQKKEDLK